MCPSSFTIVRSAVVYTLLASAAALGCLLPGRVYAQAQPLLSPIWTARESASTNDVAWGDVDNDGDLDLVVVNETTYLHLYRNDDGSMTPSAVWTSDRINHPQAAAWGDVDGDGDLDLAVGAGVISQNPQRYELEPIMVFRNDAGTLTASPAWVSLQTGYITSLEFGDLDGDSFPELAAANYGGPEFVFHNQQGQLDQSAATITTANDNSHSVAFGDVNRDGALDLAVGNWDQSLRIYMNVGGAISPSAIDIPVTAVNQDDRRVRRVAWGDVDGDQDVDLAVVTEGLDRLYRNDGGVLNLAPELWSPTESDISFDVALGDIDGDGDLDLAVGNRSPASVVYLNENNRLNNQPAWRSTQDLTTGVAWGDLDSDGDLDLATGNWGVSRIYRNESGVLSVSASWKSDNTYHTRSVAWGDMDADGDLDLAVGNLGAPNQVYFNSGGVLAKPAAWRSQDIAETYSVAWGDVDGDSDLDLVAGNRNSPTRLYRNNNGMLESTPAWASAEVGYVRSVAWGDVDSDGDLDLVTGGYGPELLYYNVNGTLTATAVWTSGTSDETRSVAWGDMDNDGDLDLAVGNWRGFSLVYQNERGVLASSPVWVSQYKDSTTGVAWGDMDGDGDVDLVSGNLEQPDRLYENRNGALETDSTWNSFEVVTSMAIDLADVDGDGDLDVVLSSDVYAPIRLYRNDAGTIASTAMWRNLPEGASYEGTLGVAWGDIDGDGDLDLAAGSYRGVRVYYNSRNVIAERNGTPRLAIRLNPSIAAADAQSSSTVWTSPIMPITYTLFAPDGKPVQRLAAFYSLDGGGKWLPAEATPDTPLTNLATALDGGAGIAATHVFTWDVAKSGVMGQSDSVVLRLIAIPDVRTQAHSVPGPYRHGAYAAESLPMRLRGTQIRVVDTAGEPIAGAVVYRLPQGYPTGGTLLADGAGLPFVTSSQGWLQGRGAIQAGDRLLAMKSVQSADKYTLYYTSGQPSEAGMDDHVVSQLGVQTLTVSAQNPLLLFDLIGSLEWDASSDPVFLSRIEQDLKKTSQALYDWSDGQVALGNVTVYQDRQEWETADIRIFASNQVRPTANRGGIVSETLVLNSVQLSEPITLTKGEIRIGPEWNRYGDVKQIGDDWPRVLAHEIGHYALFLEDTYLGLDTATGLLGPVSTCTGTAMSDPYDDESSELRFEYASWQVDCGNSLAELPDWSLMLLAYPQLVAPQQPNWGPTQMPHMFTHVALPLPVANQPALLFDSAVNLDNVGLAGGRAYVVQNSSGRLTDLGRAGTTNVVARGAREGDKLCVFGNAEFGCTALTNRGPAQFTVHPLWRPNLSITPVNTTTLRLRLDGVAAGVYVAVVYPNAANALTVTLTPGSDHLVQLLPAATEVAVALYGSDQSQQLITSYAAGSGPGRARSHDGPGRARSHDGPFTNADGHVIIYPPAAFPDNQFLAVQTASLVPEPPPGRVVIGRSYQLRSSAEGISFDSGSITFQYFGMDLVLANQPEQNLTVYYWNGAAWQRLATTLNTRQNFASAPLVGQGLYTLMSGMQIPLCCLSWNQIGFPVEGTMPVTAALQSIEGAFSALYDYRPEDTADHWKLYAVDVPDWVNELKVMEFGRGYWINVTKVVTWYVAEGPLGGASMLTVDAAASMPPPPATFYGILSAHAAFTPASGQQVIAWINGAACGRTDTQLVNQEIVFSIDVDAEAPQSPGCGMADREITFTIAGVPMANIVRWDNNVVQQLTLLPASDAADGTDDTDDTDDTVELPYYQYLPVISR